MAEDNYHKMKRRSKANVDNNKYKNLNGKGTELLRLKLNNFSTNAVVRTLSTELRMSLFGVEIEDLLRQKRHLMIQNIVKVICW